MGAVDPFLTKNYRHGKFKGRAHAPQAADFAFIIEHLKAARQAASQSSTESGPAANTHVRFEDWQECPI